MLYELIIIGGGPAAITAGIYAARKKVKTLLICADWGGQMAYAPDIENYPGFEKITGIELVNKFKQHLKNYPIEILEHIRVEKIETISGDNPIFKIRTLKGEEFQAKAVIVATGKVPRKLNIPKEEEFIGKGISFCAICDAPLYKDKVVAVVGGGNSGCDSSLLLSQYAKKIYILQFGPNLTCDVSTREKIRENKKIQVITNAQVKEIYGDKFIKGVKYQDRTSKEIKNLDIDGLLIAIGSLPASHPIKEMIKLNEDGEIIIDKNNMTSQKGIFAAGDVTDVCFKQIIIAAGEGAKAALSVCKYLGK